MADEWEALQRSLDAEAERREQEAEESAGRYAEWQADRRKRAVQALSTIDLDLRKVGARGQGEGERLDAHQIGTGLDVHQIDQPTEREVMEQYALTGEMDAADLLRLKLTPARTLVEGIVAAGTTVLAAPPKIGKSWLVTQLGVEVALGGMFLDRQCVQGDVLYLPLEDGQERTQRRITKLLAGRTLPRGSFTVRWDCPPLGDGMEAMIEDWLDRHEQAALVIVDTLGRVRTPGDGRRNAYQVDVQDVGRLQSLIREHPGTALILVHHTKKGREDDFVEQVSGTLGISGSADTVLTINRKRMADLATINVTSRELPEAEVGTRFANGVWAYAPEAAAGISPQRLTVYDAIKEHGPLWPVAIARLLRSERTAVQHLVNALLEDGLVERTPTGYAVIPDGAIQTH